MVQDRSFASRLFDVVNYTLLTLFAMITVLPFIYVIAVSFATPEEVARRGFILFSNGIFAICVQIYLFHQYADTQFGRLDVRDRGGNDHQPDLYFADGLSAFQTPLAHAERTAFDGAVYDAVQRRNDPDLLCRQGSGAYKYICGR